MGPMKTAVSALLLATTIASTSLVGCDASDPTSAVVDNAYPRAPNGVNAEQTTVFKAWWSVTLFADPVGAGSSSDPNRVVPASDYAYALLAPSWAPDSPSAPGKLVAVRTKEKVSVARGDTLQITISSDSVVGNCDDGSHLSQKDADFITQRIFPGDFTNMVYDPTTCVATGTLQDGQKDDAGIADSISSDASSGNYGNRDGS
jgi:hypothetical protein